MRLVLFLILYFLFLPLNADSFKASFDRMCQKMTDCTLQQMKSNTAMNDQQKQMVMQMVAGMCERVQNEWSLQDAESYPGLAEKGSACMDSMTSLDCAVLMNNPKTAECEEYEKWVNKQPGQ